MRREQSKGVQGLTMTLAASALALAGCGEYDGVSATTAGGEPGREVPAPAISHLTCYTNERVMGIFDHFSDGGGAESPEVAMAKIADGDELVVDETSPGLATAWVLRADGTAHSQFGLRRLSDGTWIMETQHSCQDPRPTGS